MSFWRDVLKATPFGSFVKDKDKGGFDSSSLETHKRTVGKSKQAGGGQIRYNTEETYTGPADKKPSSDIINPQFNSQGNRTSFWKKGGGEGRNFYTGTSGRKWFGGGNEPASAEDGMRSEAARKLWMKRT